MSDAPGNRHRRGIVMHASRLLASSCWLLRLLADCVLLDRPDQEPKSRKLLILPS